MNSFFKSYKSTIILLGSIIAGGIVGAIVGPKASVVQPLGDLFLNLMFMIIVPLVFFSVSSAIANMTELRRLGKIIATTFAVFICTSIAAAIIGVVCAIIVNPTKGLDISSFSSLMSKTSQNVSQTKNLTFLQHIVNTVTVSDFNLLLSKSNMLPLIVFSILFGVSTAIIGEKGKPVSVFLSSASEVMLRIVKIVMYYAPIGLGCYFASVIGQLGTQILGGYLRVFLLYIFLTIIYFFGFYTLYAFISAGKLGIKTFWKNITAPSITALATCSSAACIPVNIEYCKKMGVPADIAETVLPLGANTHKDGSVFGGVMKLVFIFGLFGKNVTDPKTLIGIIVVAFLVGAVMGAIPNGGMIGEMLILTVYGFPLNTLPIIALVSTIIDVPATLLNSTGNAVSSMMITRFVEGKNWLSNFCKPE
ncbi:dicarboxylate/amino acid:cation symporter [Clostridium oryzae]|uniref:Proton/sodium-glutamate symport protein n=1 Tax=Clostridium oryzae TaxID=1450648 RepID=A0A1V4IE46_9CLOT|nr:dicarboxylate/amino acid:cation symporter [Clostridium oryzae]OPJ58134.1 proton/sodium-glutamate symport protein [Clostridium oryzae]